MKRMKGRRERDARDVVCVSRTNKLMKVSSARGKEINKGGRLNKRRREEEEEWLMQTRSVN